MFAYYLRLGVLHLRRNPVLTLLMVLTLAVGVAASMATLTVLYAMSGDPIPHKSDRLFVPLLDPRPATIATDNPLPPGQLTYRDTVNLYQAGRGVRQSAMFMVSPVVDAGRSDVPPFFSHGLAIHSDFFEMLDIPFVEGSPWTREDDDRAAQVVVIREKLANRLFDGESAVGKTIRVGARDHVIAGVVADAWDPVPRFYRLIGGPGPFAGEDELFVPFPTAIAAEMDQQGWRDCYGDQNGPGGPSTYEEYKAAECVWMNLWVELESADDAPAYRDFLTGYVAEQRKLGRLPRPESPQLLDVMQWLERNEVVSQDSRLQTYLAFGFLLVCLVNTIALLLAKFTARSGEIGVRRALGASRRTVFGQFLVEAGVIGLVGGLVGLGLTVAALAVMARQSDQLATVARMDYVMLTTTLGLAIASSLLAGLLPTWRACKVQPALQLKSQ